MLWWPLPAPKACPKTPLPHSQPRSGACTGTLTLTLTLRCAPLHALQSGSSPKSCLYSVTFSLPCKSVAKMNASVPVRVSGIGKRRPQKTHRTQNCLLKAACAISLVVCQSLWFGPKQSLMHLKLLCRNDCVPGKPGRSGCFPSRNVVLVLSR